MNSETTDNPVLMVQQDGFLSVEIVKNDEPETAIEELNRMFEMGRFFPGWYHSPEYIAKLVRDASKEASRLHWDHSHEGGPLDASRPGSPADFIGINLTRLSRFLTWLWGFANSDIAVGKALEGRIDKVTKVIEILRAEREKAV